MAPYLFTFSISLYCCVIGEKQLKHGNKYIAKTMLFFAVLVVAILAGVRDYSIGTDIATYGNYEFAAALRSNNIFELIITYL